MTGFVDRIKHQELRQIALNDLKEFIPKNHYGNDDNNAILRCHLDYKLWKIINDLREQRKIILTKKQDYASKVLIDIAFLIINDKILQSQLQPKEINPLSNEEKNILKNNIDQVIRLKLNLEDDVRYLIKHTKNADTIQFYNFFSKTKSTCN